MPSLNTGNAILSNPIKVDSSYNVGIGGAASGSFKLQVTGTTNLTGALTGTSAGLSSTLSAMGTNIQFNLDGTFGTNYYTMGFGGVSNGFNRISGGTGTTDGLYITSATGRDIVFRTNGSASNTLVLLSTGAATFSSNVAVGGSTDDTSGGLYTNIAINATTYSRYSLLTGGTARARFQFDGTNTSITTTSTGGKLQLATAAATSMEFITNDSLKMTITSGGNVGIGASTNPQNLLEVSAAGGSPRIRVGTLQNNNNTPRVEVITSGTVSTANSAWLRVTPNGGFVLGQSSYTKAGGDSGNFANLSSEVESPSITVTSGGNVGIGTSSPASRLSVQWDRSTAFSGLGVYDSQAFNASNHGGTITFGGTFNSGGSITEWASVGGTKANTTDGDYAGNLSFYTRPNGSGMIERMTILSSGQTNFTHNTTNQDIIYATNGSASPYGMNITFTGAAPNNTTNNFIYLADTSGLKCRIVSNGSIYNSTGTYGPISDIKFKENIVDATPKLDDILKLKVRNFNLIGDETKQIGFVAQEFEEIFPNMVDNSKDKETGDEYKAIKMSVLIPILVKAIQEQQAQIEAQQQQINSLINR